jgi:hypothetical protein
VRDFKVWGFVKLRESSGRKSEVSLKFNYLIIILTLPFTCGKTRFDPMTFGSHAMLNYHLSHKLKPIE